MRIIRAKDLKERLIPLFEESNPTPTGGQTLNWIPGLPLWGIVEALTGQDGYLPHSQGGGMASGQGSLRDIPEARYRVIVPVPPEDDHPLKRFFWESRKGRRLLDITRQPVLIQRQHFYQLTTVEITNDSE